MSDCPSIRSQFSEYLDGAISGSAMHSIASHLEHCQECTTEFAEWRTLQRVMTSIGPAKPPVDLGLRLRVAISQEKARQHADVWTRGNSIGKIPYLQCW